MSKKAVSFRLSSFLLLTLIAASLAACDGSSRENYQSSPKASQINAEIKDYGAFALLKSPDGSLYIKDKVTGASSPLPDANKIMLANGAETVKSSDGAVKLNGLKREPTIRLVHHLGPIPEGFVKAMTEAGIKTLNYVPNNAYAVYCGLDALKTFVESGRFAIDFARDFTPEDKKYARFAAKAGIVGAAILTVNGGDGEKAVYENADSTMMNPSNLGAFTVHRVRIAAQALNSLLKRDDVYWAEKFEPPIIADERQGMTFAGSHDGKSPTGPGYLNWLKSKGIEDLSDVIVDVTDTGCDQGTPETVSHPDLKGLIIAINNFTAEATGNDLDGHGTINASIIGGMPPQPPTADLLDDLGYLYGLGVAPGCKIVCTKVMTSLAWASTGSFTQIISAAGLAGSVISSNSWGMMVDASAYDSGSAEYDKLVRDYDADPSNGLAPMIIIFAAGNEGKDDFFGEKLQSLRSPGTAKNMITVGASENYRFNGVKDGCEIDDKGADNIADIIHFSSRGPTQDYRMKPDIVAPGTHVEGAATTDPGAVGGGTCDRFMPANQTLYSWSSGTSHATPGVAGMAAVIYKYMKTKNGEAPSPALMRALLTAHAVDIADGDNGFGKPTEHIPSVRQGWGRAQMDAMLDDAPKMTFDQKTLFTATGQTYDLANLRPADRTKPVKITLTWTDAPGATVGAAYCNDLDLLVKVNGATNYAGNAFIDGKSVPYDQFQAFNNVEHVFLDSSSLAFFTLSVIARNIVADGVPGNESAQDQDFALYIYNVKQSEGCDEDADCYDGVNCTNDKCGAETRKCSFEPDGSVCETIQCSKASCDAAEGCKYEPIDSGSCDDGLVCTTDDACVQGACVGKPLDCRDAFACTIDMCDEAANGCSHSPDDSLCEDGPNYVSKMCLMTKGCDYRETVGYCDKPISFPIPFKHASSLEYHSAKLGELCGGSIKSNGREAVYSLDLKAGDEIEASLEVSGFDGALALIEKCEEGGECLADANDAAKDAAEKLRYAAEKDGKIFLIVKAMDHPLETKGEYSLEVKPAAPTIDGDEETAEETEEETPLETETASDGDDETAAEDEEAAIETETKPKSSSGGCGQGGAFAAFAVLAFTLAMRKPRQAALKAKKQ